MIFSTTGYPEAGYKKGYPAKFFTDAQRVLRYYLMKVPWTKIL